MQELKSDGHIYDEILLKFAVTKCPAAGSHKFAQNFY